MAAKFGPFEKIFSATSELPQPLCPQYVISIAQSIRHSITTESLFRRLSILDLDSYYHNRVLRWAGHVARMPMNRAP
jgi:hypothetical protein